MSIASDLTTLCTDQTTLVNDILAQVILADLSASSIATLGSFPSDSSDITAQLVAGGDATLSVPVVDGVKFRVCVAGHSHNSLNASSITVKLVFNGAVTAFILNQGGSSTSPNQPFMIIADCVWDSTSNKLLMAGNTISCSASGVGTPSVTSDNPVISSPSSLNFKINGRVDQPNSSATVAITEFRAFSN